MSEQRVCENLTRCSEKSYVCPSDDEPKVHKMFNSFVQKERPWTLFFL